MAGFPFFQLDRYLKILVEEHQKYVALCEEYRKPIDDTSSKLEFERRVVRIITPGTLIDERFIDPYENNFLLAVYTPDSQTIETGIEKQDVGLAWLDLSTGDFFTQQTEISSLPGDIARIAPREILLNEDLRSDRSHSIFTSIEEEKHFITYEPFTDLSLTTIPNSWEELLEAPISPRVAKEFSVEEIRAAEVLLRSVKGKLMGTNMRIQPPIRKSKQDIMIIDANTLRALEIKRSMREGNIKGSLLSAIRRTVTKSGARLFADMICTLQTNCVNVGSPITSIREINRRLDLVDTFLGDSHLLADIIHYLRQTHDSQRLVQRFSLGRGDSDDLLSLSRTIRETEKILARLREQNHPSLEHLIAKIVIPEKLCEKIEATIDEEGLVKRQRLEELETAELGKLVRRVEGQDIEEDGKKKKREEFKNEDVWIMKKTLSSY
jgi:DNA mismatch repair ATPase MutS